MPQPPRVQAMAATVGSAKAAWRSARRSCDGAGVVERAGGEGVGEEDGVVAEGAEVRRGRCWTRSGLAAEAGETTAMRAPGLEGGGFQGHGRTTSAVARVRRCSVEKQIPPG